MVFSTEVTETVTRIEQIPLPLPYHGKKGTGHQHLIRIEAQYWPHLPEKLKGFLVQKLTRNEKEAGFVNQQLGATPADAAKVKQLIEQYGESIPLATYQHQFRKTQEELHVFTF
jgi:hypothetical protein